MRSYSRVFRYQAIAIKVKLLREIPFSLLRSPYVWFILPGCPFISAEGAIAVPPTAELTEIRTWSSCCVCSFALMRCRAAWGYPQESLMLWFVTLYIILFSPPCFFLCRAHALPDKHPVPVYSWPAVSWYPCVCRFLGCCLVSVVQVSHPHMQDSLFAISYAW